MSDRRLILYCDLCCKKWNKLIVIYVVKLEKKAWNKMYNFAVCVEILQGSTYVPCIIYKKTQKHDFNFLALLGLDV